MKTRHIPPSVCLFCCIALSVSHGENRVLSLDGDGDYVRIPNAPELQGGENVVKTIEAWCMPKEGFFQIVGKSHSAIRHFPA